MPLTTHHYTLGTAVPTKVCSADQQPQTVWVHNDEHSQSDRVFLGNASVSTATGFHLDSTESMKIDLDPGSDLWAISDSNGSQLHIMCLKQD